MPISSSSPSPTDHSLVPRHDRFADGSVKASGFELDGKLHGHWEWFRQDGSLMRSGQFHLGTQQGIWRTWDRAGRLVKETSFPPPPSPERAASAATADQTASSTG